MRVAYATAAAAASVRSAAAARRLCGRRPPPPRSRLRAPRRRGQQGRPVAPAGVASVRAAAEAGAPAPYGADPPPAPPAVAAPVGAGGGLFPVSAFFPAGGTPPTAASAAATRPPTLGDDPPPADDAAAALAPPAAAAGFDDTIFALSSAPGVAGVAVFRLSGPAAGAALLTLTRRRALPPPRVATLVSLYAPSAPPPSPLPPSLFHDPMAPPAPPTSSSPPLPAPDLLDRPLVLWFPAPASFTGEDVAELHVHGSAAVTDAVTAALATLPGLRPAGRGEFTRRALAAGRLDLTEVEGLADLLAADTPAARRAALAQLGGTLRRLYARWRGELTDCLAIAEAVLDFGEEGGLADGALYAGLVPRVSALRAEMAAHLADRRVGERARLGLGVAVLGAPNAGKSTLVNALARRPAAIVSGEAGTTRDVVAVPLTVGGVGVTVRDTAGVRGEGGGGDGGSDGDGDAARRGGVGGVEREGIRRARAAAASADVVLFVLDAAAAAAAAAEGGRPDLDVEASWAALADAVDRPPPTAEGPPPADTAADEAYAALSRAGVASLPSAMTPTYEAADVGCAPPTPHVILIVNKADLLGGGTEAAAAAAAAALARFRGLSSAAPAAAVAVSLASGAGGNALLGCLEGAVRHLAGQPLPPPPSSPLAVTQTPGWPAHPAAAATAAHADTPMPRPATAEAAVITRARHRAHVTTAVAALDSFLAGRTPRATAAAASTISERAEASAAAVAEAEASGAYGLPMDVAAEELRVAARAVAEITGAVPVEEVLDVVFREFCIGK